MAHENSTHITSQFGQKVCFKGRAVAKLRNTSKFYCGMSDFSSTLI